MPEFAAQVLSRRVAPPGPRGPGAHDLRHRGGGPLSQHKLRRTFREFLVLSGLEDAGITPRWDRRTGATVPACGLGVGAAATHLGHTSTAITEVQTRPRSTRFRWEIRVSSSLGQMASPVNTSVKRSAWALMSGRS